LSRVDLQEFLEAYLGEMSELLVAANALLLSVDAAHRRSEATPRPIRELFRALHTVKGLSAMVGVEPIVAIAHRMEGMLRDADRAGGLLPVGGVDMLLEGVRGIEQRKRALEQGREVAPAPTRLLDAMDSLDVAAVSHGPEASVELALDPAVASKLGDLERATMVKGVRGGRRAICVRFAPSTERAAAGFTINSVRQGLSARAEIVKVVPIAEPPSESAPAGMSFALVALTTEADGSVAGALGLDRSSITTVAEPQANVAPRPEPADELDELDELDGLDERGGRDASNELAELDDDEPIAVAGGFVRVDVGRLDDVLEHLAALVVGRSALTLEVARLESQGLGVRELTRLHREQARQVRALRAALLRLRMVPVSDVLDRVPLIVRSVRRATDKLVRLEIDGGRAELDKAVAERIFPAIVHLVRNAVDHAIEPPQARARLGKPEEGLVRIEAQAKGSQLELSVIDDGCGIDAASVAARANAEVPETHAGLLQLLCRPGLTTRDEVSATSGRGMGMDIVHKVVVGQLGGELTLHTVPGQGTTFRLRVPLTISIVDAFTFECAAQRFVVPLAVVDEVVDLEASRVVPTPGRGGLAMSLLEQHGETVPLVGLAEVLALRAQVPPRRALVVRRDGEAMAFAIDRMLGQQEVAVRPLEDPLLAVDGVAGATDLGDGRATLVVDLVALRARISGTLPTRGLPSGGPTATVP
jgi:two-component system, chemotaxis family, sensor kinase CheA